MTINLISVSGQAYVSGNYVNVASIVADTYDRKGDIVWYDGFEHGLNKWTAVGGGAGNSMDITSAAAHYHDNCCMLTCGSTGSLKSSIQKYLNLYSTGNLGFEVSFSNDSNIDRVAIEAIKFEADTSRWALVEICKSGVLRYLKADGAWSNIETSLRFSYATTHWYTVKMVLNFAENKYLRIIHRDKTYDIDADIRLIPAIVSPECIGFTVKAFGTATVNAKALIDNILITQDEP